MKACRGIIVPILPFALVCSVITISWAERGTRDPADCAQDPTACRARAEKGDPGAEAALGEMYLDGRGVQQDYAEALRWTRKAAEQGDASGQNTLGIMYSTAKGVPQDYTEAVCWYRKAADQGFAKAQYNLGNMYYYGRGVREDRTEAQVWYQKAADQGDSYAQSALGLRWRLTTTSAATLWAMLLACFWALKDAVLPRANAQHHQPQTLTVGGIFGLAYIGLSLYGHFTLFKTMLAASFFHFLNTLMAGVAIGMFISVVAPKAVKPVLCASGLLLTMNDLAVIWRHALARFVVTPRGFSSINGLLIGLSVALAMLLWLWPNRKIRARAAHSTRL